MDAGKIPRRIREPSIGVSMDIDVKELGTVTVVAPHGDVDMAVADLVRVRLTRLVDRGSARLVLDLGGVMYIDSSGLGAVVAAMKHARSAGGDIKVCELASDVRAVFEMTRLDKVLSIHTTCAEAIAAWG
jgi:anti-sigma B factor antagonist